MLESVDWTDLGSVVERRVGSSPTARTKATAGLLAAAFICVCGGMHEMRPYKKLTIVCAIISLFSLALCLVLHYWMACEEAEFWINVCLALFGSAILTMLNSLVFYFHEKRTTLENFMYFSKNLLQVLNKYQTSMSLEEKMRFYLDYHDMDKSAWDSAYGNMDFFFEKAHGNRAYIYKSLYLPILKFNKAVNEHVWHFRWYFDGSGKNAPVMEGFVEQLEKLLIYQDAQSVPTEYDESGKPVAFCEMVSIESKLVHEVLTELNGKYLDIMYGKSKK